MQTFFHLVQSD